MSDYTPATDEIKGVWVHDSAAVEAFDSATVIEGAQS